MTSIGNTLKEARGRKSLTLEDVHAKLKIHPRVLQLLEDDRFEKLPSPLFVKSFIKTYADFLEVNGEELVQTYERESRRDPEQVLFIKPAELRNREADAKAAPWKPLMMVVASILVVTVGYAAYKGIENFRATHPAFARKAESVKSLKSAKPAKVVASGVVVPAAVPAKQGKEWLRSPEQGNFPKIAKTEPLELTVRALDNVWLRVTCDGKVLFQSILRRETQERWVANQSVEIWTGNSSNMALTLNGRSLGSPGQGVVKKMVITRSGVKTPS